ncbi:Uncharacterised protein [Mycobacteroides abscessus subsp. abscessus]|nr:Uncharacterised protein [Mycobacteroides abscessus subsp. abscessus]
MTLMMPRTTMTGTEAGSRIAAAMITAVTTRAVTTGGKSVRGTRSRTSSASATIVASAVSEESIFRSLIPACVKCVHSTERNRPSAPKTAEWRWSRLT